MDNEFKILDPSPGLPVAVAFLVEKEGKTYYAYEWQHPAVAATVVLRCTETERFLLILREHEPFAKQFAFPGGFLDVGKERIEETASRELFEEAGVSIPPEELVLVDVRSDPNRDPRDHAFDIAFYAEVESEAAVAMDETLEVRWFSSHELNNKNDFAFDHSELWMNVKKLLEID